MCEDMCTYAWMGEWDILVLVLVIDREKEESKGFYPVLRFPRSFIRLDRRMRKYGVRLLYCDCTISYNAENSDEKSPCLTSFGACA